MGQIISVTFYVGAYSFLVYLVTDFFEMGLNKFLGKIFDTDFVKEMFSNIKELFSLIS